MVDSVVVLFKTNNNTTKYNTTMRKKLNKFFLNSPPRQILKRIIQLEAFTVFTLQSQLGLDSPQIYPVLRFLREFEVIQKHTKIRGRGGAPVNVFLLDGGDESRIPAAISQHFDLMPRGAVRMLECYVNPAIVDSLVMRLEKSRLDRTVEKSSVIKLVKELGDPLDYNIVLETLKHFRERGWEVIL